MKSTPARTACFTAAAERAWHATRSLRRCASSTIAATSSSQNDSSPGGLIGLMASPSMKILTMSTRSLRCSRTALRSAHGPSAIWLSAAGRIDVAGGCAEVATRRQQARAGDASGVDRVAQRNVDLVRGTETDRGRESGREHQRGVFHGGDRRFFDRRRADRERTRVGERQMRVRFRHARHDELAGYVDHVGSAGVGGSPFFGPA